MYQELAPRLPSRLDFLFFAPCPPQAGLGPWGSPPHTPSQEPGRGTVGEESPARSRALTQHSLGTEGCFGTTSQKKMVLMIPWRFL